jgi:hypothetical protein
MYSTEVTIMAMTQERERLLREQVEEGRIRRALAERPAGRGRGLQSASHLAAGVRRRCRRWLQLPWDEPAPRVSVATACDT